MSDSYARRERRREKYRSQYATAAESRQAHAEERGRVEPTRVERTLYERDGYDVLIGGGRKRALKGWEV